MNLRHATNMPASNLRPRRYWLRLTVFFVVSLTVALLGLPLLLGSLSMLGLLYAPCSSGGLTPAGYGLGWEDVTISARTGGDFRGFFMPGTNGATIIMPPPFTSGRDGRLRQADMMVRHGYTVFTFESRRCAAMGPLSLGYQEADDVADVLAYLQSRPDVDPDRIGVHGFSSAGATAVLAAARMPALRAVVAEGGYGDFPEETLGPANQGGLMALFQNIFNWSARLTYRLVTGVDINELSPTDVIARIEPRPVFLVYGSQELSLIGARHQMAAAGEHTTLFIVTGAGHGNYLDVASAEYEAEIVKFFGAALK